MFPNPKKALVALWVSMLISHSGFSSLLLSGGNNLPVVASETGAPGNACSSEIQASMQSAFTACIQPTLTITAYIPAIRNNACAMGLPFSTIETTARTTYEILAQHCFYRKKVFSEKRFEEDDDQPNPKA